MRLCGRMEDAVRCYGNAARLDPGNARIWTSCGVVQARLQSLRAATECYRRSLRLAPANPDVQAELGILNLILGRPADAAAACRRSLALIPGDGRMLAYLSAALGRAGAPDNAAAVWRWAERVWPAGTPASMEIADRLALGQAHDAAARVYERVVREAPGTMVAWRRLVASRIAERDWGALAASADRAVAATGDASLRVARLFADCIGDPRPPASALRDGIAASFQGLSGRGLILLAPMKTASTYFSRVLSGKTSRHPGYRKTGIDVAASDGLPNGIHLVKMHEMLSDDNPARTIFLYQGAMTEREAAIVEATGLPIVIIHRNILDCLISLHDHMVTEARERAAEYGVQPPPPDRDAVIGSHGAYYVDFVSWCRRIECRLPERSLTLTYEQVTRDGQTTFERVCDFLGDPMAASDVAARLQAAIALKSQKRVHGSRFHTNDLKFNVGTSGRGGAMLTPAQKALVAELAARAPADPIPRALYE